jgi:tRNA-splicing ligase RtcB
MTDDPTLRTWLIEPPDPAVKQTLDRLIRAPDVRHIAAMPDLHLAAGVSNGVAVATEQLLYPAAVGADIGCGFACVALDGDRSAFRQRANAEAVFNRLPHVVPIVRHSRRQGVPALPDDLDAARLSASALSAQAARDGRAELGTLGRGNHFLEIQDDAGRLWLMVHSGSRALGQHITAHHLAGATPVGGGLAWLDSTSPAGQAYVNDVGWARAYAAESRRRMLAAAAALLADLFRIEPDWSTLLNTDHNHLAQEEHHGRVLWVHRKGANAAHRDLLNVIPGSMATRTYHVVGRAAPAALASSSHGAGLRLSRDAARSRLRRRDVARALANVWTDPRVLSRLVDEAPAAYKDIAAVMRAQRDLVRIVRILQPVLSYKGV